MLFLLLNFLDQLAPIISIVINLTVLLTVLIFYWKNKLELTYFLMILLFSLAHIATFFEVITLYHKDLFISLFLYFTVFSIVCYEKHKHVSFTFVYLASFAVDFYLYYFSQISVVVLGYGFYFFVFFSYHLYFTFTKRFLLRSYSVLRFFLRSTSFVKAIAWIILVLSPALVNNLFIFLLVFNQVVLLSFLSKHYLVTIFLILLWLWFVFLAVTAHFKVCKGIRDRISAWLSRKACLHYI